MKTIHLTLVLATLACFVLVGTSVSAQVKTPKNPTSTASATVKSPYRLSLLKNLDLSKEEKAEIKQIRSADREQVVQKILAVLTPEQKAQLQQLPSSTNTTQGKHKKGSV